MYSILYTPVQEFPVLLVRNTDWILLEYCTQIYMIELLRWLRVPILSMTRLSRLMTEAIPLTLHIRTQLMNPSHLTIYVEFPSLFISSMGSRINHISLIKNHIFERALIPSLVCIARDSTDSYNGFSYPFTPLSLVCITRDSTDSYNGFSYPLQFAFWPFIVWRLRDSTRSTSIVTLLQLQITPWESHLTSIR